MNNRDIVVIGASAGGLHALRTILRGLPADFHASVFVVQHMAPAGPGLLATILQDGCALPVVPATDGAPIERGRVYVARPDRHLTVDREQVRVTRGPRENLSRPAVDPLFRSAALAFGGRVVGVVLTGRLDDGTAGLWAVKQRGGLTVVQDPDDAEYPSMPRNALKYVRPDHVVPLAEVALLLERLTGEPAPTSEEPSMTEELRAETAIAQEDNALQVGVLRMGELTPYTCPECHGVLVRIREEAIPRFRCHTGHAYSLESLLEEVSRGIEETLWSAVRAMEEGVLLLDHLSEHMGGEGGDDRRVEEVRRKARETERRSQVVRGAAITHEPLTPGEEEPGS